MKMIQIYRHIDCEGPAHLQLMLEKRNIPFELICIDKGETVRNDISEVAGLIFMGGSMSANDDLKWIHQELDLIRAAVRKNIPVLGVCLGSQLIAKALGAKVFPGPKKCMELGWFPVESSRNNKWTSDLPDHFDVFHWHGETFDLPEGATHLFSNERYENQGFAIGPHLGLQFHVEMNSESVREWVSRYTEDIEQRCLREHDANAMLENIDDRITKLQEYAEILFNIWLEPIVPSVIAKNSLDK